MATKLKSQRSPISQTSLKLRFQNRRFESISRHGSLFRSVRSARQLGKPAIRPPHTLEANPARRADTSLPIGRVDLKSFHGQVQTFARSEGKTAAAASSACLPRRKRQARGMCCYDQNWSRKSNQHVTSNDYYRIRAVSVKTNHPTVAEK